MTQEQFAAVYRELLLRHHKAWAIDDDVARERIFRLIEGLRDQFPGEADLYEEQNR